MKNNKNMPVQVVLHYNPNSSADKTLQAKIISVEQGEAKILQKKMEESAKLIRRYSFDDNGGGYRGL